VESEPSALVYVNGRLLGTAGASQRAPLEIPLPTTGESPYEATASLRLEFEDRPPVRARLRLRAGTDLTFAAQPAEPPYAEPAGPPAPREESP
jgi:serine/threonine-protein kinase